MKQPTRRYSSDHCPDINYRHHTPFPTRNHNVQALQFQPPVYLSLIHI